MIYLDYAATTPVSNEVKESINNSISKYIGNPNSLHRLGQINKEVIDNTTLKIKEILELNDYEIIYTSGSSEANNLAIKGIKDNYETCHIITTSLEHSSIISPLNYLQTKNCDIDFVDVLDNGLVDIDHLKSLIKANTILVSIASVSSEVGVVQDISKIASAIKEKNPKCLFHVDMTQSITKIKTSYENIDMFSFSAHKFYGMKGIGALVIKKDINLNPLIHGGKSTTIYRSGTPALELIVSLGVALENACAKMSEKYNYVKSINNDIYMALSKINDVFINSNELCLPHILNVSILGVSPKKLQEALEKREIYISTQTACSAGSEVSNAVLNITKNIDRAKSSIRISLSPLTTRLEVEEFIAEFTNCVMELRNIDANN